MIPRQMRAVLLTEPTPAQEVVLSSVPVPQVCPGWVLIRIKAFGLNHSEQILRLQEIRASYIRKPVIPGIECVGEIADPSDSHFHPGEKVAALMGGMGRSFHGSYAEYALVPASHVFAVQTGLSWREMAAVPETWFTAWGSLFACLHLQASDTLLIRGATCALGYAAIQIANAIGCKVIATTHRETKLPLLRERLPESGSAILDPDVLAGTVRGITKALELVGPKTLRDTLRSVEKGGIVCHTGILGGIYTLNAFDPIKEIPNGVYLTGFFSNYPTRETIEAIFRFIDHHQIRPMIGAVYAFDQIAGALSAMDGHQINGKIVVEVETA